MTAVGYGYLPEHRRHRPATELVTRAVEFVRETPTYERRRCQRRIGRKGAGPVRSVIVVMVVVCRVPVAVVDVVDVVTVRDGDVTAALAVHMGVLGVFAVRCRFALVVMAVVSAMQVAVVHVIDMVTVRDRDMAAVRAMDVFMICVLGMSCCRHSTPLPRRPGFPTCQNISTRASIC